MVKHKKVDIKTLSTAPFFNESSTPNIYFTRFITSLTPFLIFSNMIVVPFHIYSIISLLGVMYNSHVTKFRSNFDNFKFKLIWNLYICEFYFKLDGSNNKLKGVNFSRSLVFAIFSESFW